jgi:membrane protease subunit HflC
LAPSLPPRTSPVRRARERAGHRARVRQAGAHHLEPGLYWKIPGGQTVDTFDKRILDLDTAEQEVTAADQKRLKVDAFARYRIVDPLLFYQAVRDERSVRSRLGPITESRCAACSARRRSRRGARQARSPHEADANQVNEEARSSACRWWIVRIKRADLPEQNPRSIYDRMRAERQREAAEFRAEGSPAPIAFAPTRSRRYHHQGGGDARG